MGVTNDVEKRPSRARIELLPGVSLELLERCPNTYRLAVGTIGGHGVEGVASEDDTAGEGYMLPQEAVGVALAVSTLVFGPDNGGEMSEATDRGDDALTDYRVLLHQLLLALI